MDRDTIRAGHACILAMTKKKLLEVMKEGFPPDKSHAAAAIADALIKVIDKEEELMLRTSSSYKKIYGD